MYLFLSRAMQITAFASVLLISSSCKKDDLPVESQDAITKEVVINYANIVHASYEDSYNTSKSLRDSIRSFVENPSAEKLTNTKIAWLRARVPYLQTEAYRFYGGPIDDVDGPEGQINAWPMDEAYIDYVLEDPKSGIINDTVNFPVINKELIESLNEQGGETNISSGYHAIEFLLWGQDLNTSGPGGRPYTDYVTIDSLKTASNQLRRRQYLLASAELLTEHLGQLVDEWRNAGNYRTQFVNAPAKESIQKILLGIGSLSGGELAGERMQVALSTRAQEDEHSCFSDNTHNDIVYDQLGIENVYYGRYRRTDGSMVTGRGLIDLVLQKNNNLHNQMIERLTATETAVEAIKYPFDNEINDVAGRERISKAIESLKAQADKIVEVAAALDIKLSL